MIILFVNKMTAPVIQMAEVAAAVEQNDFSKRAQAASDDEIGVLAGAFNKMIDRISGWKEELEKQVKNRTAELNAVNQQLRASEQQLKASNQQLKASQQQLKAMNQQLVANEQRLRIEIEQRVKMEEETRKHMHELQVFYKASIGREEKIIELKRKIKELEEK